MKQRVLVTGADGFIGRHMCAALETVPDVTLEKYDIKNSIHELEHASQHADFVFHFAAVMRPEDPDEYVKVNTDLTRLLLTLLRISGHHVPVLLTSSIQAELDNPYGQSKRLAEEEVFAYGNETGNPVYVYRLPNVFGKWARPNYSSAVATWCYNIAHDLPIYVRDPDAELTLVHIDDVVSEFLAIWRGQRVQGTNVVRKLTVTYTQRLGKITETLYRFKSDLAEGRKPSPKDIFEEKLYVTYLGYCNIE